MRALGGTRIQLHNSLWNAWRQCMTRRHEAQLLVKYDHFIVAMRTQFTHAPSSRNVEMMEFIESGAVLQLLAGLPITVSVLVLHVTEIREETSYQFVDLQAAAAPQESFMQMSFIRRAFKGLWGTTKKDVDKLHVANAAGTCPASITEMSESDQGHLIRQQAFIRGIVAEVLKVVSQDVGGLLVWAATRGHSAAFNATSIFDRISEKPPVANLSPLYHLRENMRDTKICDLRCAKGSRGFLLGGPTRTPQNALNWPF